MSSKQQTQLADIGSATRDLLAVGHALGDTDIPEKHRNMSFHRNRKSLKQTIPADAWQDADISLTDPEPVTHYYFEDSQVLLVDLGGRFDDD